jgi:type IX secretion system PorP/SprF family membrane protein
MMNKWIFTFFLFATSFTVCGQDPHFSQFFSSPLTLNPASTGNFNGIARVSANYRNQWPALGKAFVTSTVAVDGGLLKKFTPYNDQFSGGLLLLSDQTGNGILKENHLGISLAYQKGLDEDGIHSISIGFQASLSNLMFDAGKANFEDELSASGFTLPSSELLLGRDLGKQYSDFHAGLLYQGALGEAGLFYLGTSIYHLNKPKLGFNLNSYYIRNRYNIHGGVYLPAGLSTTLHISGQYQHHFNYKEWMIGAALSKNLKNLPRQYKEIYVGMWIRNQDALIPYLGFEWNDLRIGFSQDLNISGKRTSANSYQSTEVSLIWILNKNSSAYNKKCPKF